MSSTSVHAGMLQRHEDARCGCPRSRKASLGRGSRSRRTPCGRSPHRGQVHGRVPHRRLHALGQGPRGIVPGDPRSRGRGRRRRRRPRRHVIEEGRPRHSALRAGVSSVRLLHVGQDQPVPGDPQHAGRGPHARRQQSVFDRRREAVPLHGHVDVRQPHGGAGDRRRQGSRGRSVSTRSATSAAASPRASAR